MRCPACGARNSEDATWCTQCYADVRAAADPTMSTAPDASGGAVGSRSGAMTGDAVTPPATAGRGTAAGRDVRDRDGTVEWRCAACDGWTPLEVATCAVCGTARRGFGEASKDTRFGEAEVVGASLVLPGLGHVLAGRVGTGLARMMLAVLWAVGGLVLVAGSSGVATLPGWLLLSSAVGLWVATAFDAKRLVDGEERQLLTTRRLGGFVLGVTVALVGSAGIVMLASA